MLGITVLIALFAVVWWFIIRMVNLPQIKVPPRDPLEDARGFEVLPPVAGKAKDPPDELSI